MSESTFWETGIVHIGPHKWTYRGYDSIDLLGRISFGTMIYLLLKGELPPNPKLGKLMDAILISMCDYGPLAPSVAATRYAASGRPDHPAAMAAGLLAVGDAHGGAMGATMELLYQGVARAKATGRSLDEIAKEIVEEHKAQKKYIPGYGSPSELGAADPNPAVAKRLAELARKAGVSGEYLELAEAIQRHIAKAVINLDGANAALCCELGLDPRLGKAIFCLSRMAGLAAEAHEEFTRVPPFRQTPYKDVHYDGPPMRQLPPAFQEEEI
ncbi:MAG TPA: citryl-CoA lyase [Dehalococcoidia bacterium]|nr:citryl-CoA lyase [Dehalococcoidia bacterium]